MELKYVTLKEVLKEPRNYRLFSEELGYFTGDSDISVSVGYIIEENNQNSSNSNMQYISLRNVRNENKEVVGIEELYKNFRGKFFVSNNYYYISPAITIKEINIRFVRETFKIKSQKALIEFVSKEYVDATDYHSEKIRFRDLKVGQKVNYSNEICTIEEVLYKQADAKCCCILKNNLNNKIIEVPFRSGCDIYTIPTEEYFISPDPFVEFTKEKNQNQLEPYIEFSSNQINVYWKGLEEASQYVVSLYKKIRHEYNNCADLYFIEDFVVDRNKHWLSISNLLGRGYIVKIKAEDRTGEVIAFTRGLTDDQNNLFER